MKRFDFNSLNRSSGTFPENKIGKSYEWAMNNKPK